ncbi:MAG: 3-phenylpropionate/cinnamic acid dioxygenase subunit beta [Cycloclasticus sp.]|jgi:ethylbenzene dioxygenase beta subunit|nr:3-phenylpropionate/cinnamic acid dioxygenase subunit beta [Cycloclasticus sp.]MEE4290848.1 3-phenylpropionate/cinnamic acid dioxygenase subunit beta [Cycloclasticus sp.]
MTSTNTQQIDTENMLLWHRVNQFYNQEARALDEEDYATWFTMLADDIHYWMPARESMFRKDETPDSTTNMNHYNESLQSLQLRVARLHSGAAWAEDPRTRYRHLITNLEVELSDVEGEVNVRSNTLVYRNRLEREEYWLLAKREDILRVTEGSFKVAKRKITPDFSSLLSKNLNVFL